ncbi:MerR family transcriptional regulator [Streptomyces sp. NPDC090306]|uniref:MerR family transcriptional regulator n=1 Tax=unclassified Streptomyces TaxID=2593676 RepID=UPI0036E00FAA
MQIGEVAARTELSLRTIRHYEETGLVVPSARSQGGFRLYTEADVQRLMVVRRMKPLGFTLDQMRDLLDATDRLDAGDVAEPARATGPVAAGGADTAPEPAPGRAQLLARVRAYEEIAARRVADLRQQLDRAEEFAATLRERIDRAEASSTGEGHTVG